MQDDAPPRPPENRLSAAARPPRRRHLLGFAFSGVVAFVVDAGVLSALMALLGIDPVLARIPSFLAAVATTWAINRTVTFRTSRPPSLGEFLGYLSAMAVGLVINYAVFVGTLAVSALAASLPVLALVPATLAGMVANFLSSRHILDR